MNNFRSLIPFLTYEDNKLKKAVLYPIRLDMHTGCSVLADKTEAKIIYDYLNEQNIPLGTELQLNDNVMEV